MKHNIQAIQEIIDIIIEYGDEHFNMGHWVNGDDHIEVITANQKINTPQCGTTYCIAGFMAITESFKNNPNVGYEEDNICLFNIDGEPDYNNAEVVAIHLQISKECAENLCVSMDFYQCWCYDSIGKGEALTALHHLKTHGNLPQILQDCDPLPEEILELL